MSATPPPAPKRAFVLPYKLPGILWSTAILTLVFAPWWYGRAPLEALAWVAGSVWMSANLYALDRLVRSALAPPDQVDKAAAVQAGTLVVVVMPAILIGLLFWGMRQESLMAMAAGITLPLLVLLLRAGSALLVGSKNP